MIDSSDHIILFMRAVSSMVGCLAAFLASPAKMPIAAHPQQMRQPRMTPDIAELHPEVRLPWVEKHCPRKGCYVFKFNSRNFGGKILEGIKVLVTSVKRRLIPRDCDK